MVVRGGDGSGSGLMMTEEGDDHYQIFYCSTISLTTAVARQIRNLIGCGNHTKSAHF